MKLHFLFAFFLGITVVALMGALEQPAKADIRIQHDMGGEIERYMRALMAIRDSGEKLVIDGDCFSSCTLFTAMIPVERVCVTRRARLGFHAAKRADGSGRQVESRALTRAMLELYPSRIRDWLNRNGGLRSQILILRGRTLRSFYPLCK